MSDAESRQVHASDAPEDGHTHAPVGEPLGPVDLTTWAYAGGGALLGLLVALALFLAGGG